MHGRPKEIQKDNWIRKPGEGIGAKWYRVKSIKYGTKITRVTLDTDEKVEYDSTDLVFYETHPGYARND
jgi:hypothetical protein